jgi:TonB family protein
MKIVAIIVFIFVQDVFGQVWIRVIDAETDLPVEQIDLIRTNKKGKILEQHTTDKNGVVYFSDHNGEILVQTKVHRYIHFPIELFKNDKNEELIYFLYPTSFLDGSPKYDSKLNNPNQESNQKSERALPNVIEVEDIQPDVDQDHNQDVIIELPESEAEFPGGSRAMAMFLSNEILYPRSALMMLEQGKVFIEFIVEKDGSINHVRVLRGVSTSIDLEAIRVIRKMPNWTPAMFEGESVRARCRVPITFRLD